MPDLDIHKNTDFLNTVKMNISIFKCSHYEQLLTKSDIEESVEHLGQWDRRQNPVTRPDIYDISRFKLKTKQSFQQMVLNKWTTMDAQSDPLLTISVKELTKVDRRPKYTTVELSEENIFVFWISRVLRCNIKSTIFKKKIKVFVGWKALPKGWKDRPETGRKCVQNLCTDI